MFIEVSKGVIVNSNQVSEITVGSDGLSISFYLKNGKCYESCYSDTYAIKNILDSIRVECGLFLKSDTKYTNE